MPISTAQTRCAIPHCCAPRGSLAEQYHAVNTATIAYYLGLEAAKRNVAAYVRVQPPYYECSAEKRDKAAHSEKDNLKPEGTRGHWHHEALRLLGAMKECALRLVLV